MYGKILGTLAAAAVSLGMATAAVAGPFLTPTQTRTFHFDTLSGFTNLVFDGFDVSLGTLESVHMTLSSTATVNDLASVVPPGPGPQSVGSPTPLTATATTQAIGPGGLFASSTVTTPGFVGIIPDDNIIHVVGTITATGLGSSDLFSPPSDLSGYIGGLNSVSILLNEFGTQGGSVPEAVLTGNNGFADITMTLAYDYSVTSTPEPMTLGILGLGLAGLGIARRRRS